MFYCTHRIQFWKKCRKHLAKVITKTLLKIREWKQKTGFSKESRWKRSSGHINCSSELYQKSFNRIEKKKIISKFGSPANCSPRCLRSRCDNSAQCFLLKVQTCWEPEKFFNQTTLSSKCFTWEGENLLDNPAIFVWICEKVSHIVWKRQKKFDFPQKVQLSVTVSRFTGHVKAYWPSCQMFFAQILKQVPSIKVFKEFFFPKSFSGRMKGTFDRLPETSFCQSNIKSSLKVRKGWVKSAFSRKKFFCQFVLLYT